VIEHLPTKHNALSSIPRTEKHKLDNNQEIRDDEVELKGRKRT
jgi:hypothetical protein